MCGITGALAFGTGVDRWHDEVARSIDRMTRRGPDDAGLWSDHASCLLGFRRLSILDLSLAGHQPMTTLDGRHALVFNGELYNFREIRDDLRTRGVTFRSTGDAEVVLQALAEYGVEALERFNGMFALAFYDARRRRLLLARDHAAIKPLYVLHHAEGLFFASQYDQVLAHPWAQASSIDQGALALYLTLGYLPPPYAMVAHTEALEAGAWMTVDSDGRIVRGRHFTLPANPVPDLTGTEALDAVDAAITTAVRRQMVSDVPVGVFLSGGIDSPLVAAKMRRATNRPVPAFTLGTQGDPLDESADAARYATALDLRHVVQHITSADALGLLDDVVTAYSEPNDDYSIFPTALISRVAREQVSVVLSGDGGDDLFWGYPSRMVDPLARAAGVPRSGWRGTFQRLAGGFSVGSGSVGPLDQSAAQRRRHMFVDPAMLAAIVPEAPSLPDDCRLFAYDGKGLDALAMWLRWNEYTGHLTKVLQKVDRASMHWSLEVRVPLLDREVIDVATRLDWRCAVDLGRGVGKRPLRWALEREAGVQTLPKRGFDPPMAAWLRGPLKPLVEDALLSRREILGVPIDQAALAGVFRQHLTHGHDASWLLWRLLSLTLWEARHLRPMVVHA